MTINLTPFLLCVQRNKLVGVIQKFDDYQKKYHGIRFNIPSYLTSRDPDIIDAPVSMEESEIETLKEMSQPPRRQERVE